MYKNFLIIIFSFATLGVAHAQANLLSAQKASDIGKITDAQIAADNDGPIPYGYVDDRDVLWSKVVWEVIDLKQKINLPLYFPKDTSRISTDRRSLFDTLLKGIRQGKITEVYEDSYFKKKFTKSEVEDRINYVREYTGKDGNQYKDSYYVKTEEVTEFMIKGMWFFDKRQGELKYRLLAIAPMAADVKKKGTIAEDAKETLELFWVFFPDAREVLHRSKVYNPQNSTQPISFDHLLNARRFSGTIVREENIYGNRAIADYIRGNSLFQLLEADKIKEDIRNKEIDMWNY
ncbi:gliding motility protein GldN [Polaribacter sp. HL-MS24]|uniref:type IX secretion system ring protein PorN/GldN n=1 Tax=Polaribacter sp. HL-MS24 TaxID=3077735 RepID=UPI002934710E|nr:gliding motility protein GldN [Polaribacter sp. HL-MS24]WOC39305.1 gliding motility protein GldN [Polaribacter sp. HL-MS24]